MNEQELRLHYQTQGYSADEIDAMLGLKADRFKGVEDLPFGCVPDEGKPRANEHTCDIAPGRYDSYARKNCFRRVSGKCIDFLFGIKGGKSTLAALYYKKTIWTAAGAKADCKRRDGTFIAATG